jgi:hypothetical protein
MCSSTLLIGGAQHLSMCLLIINKSLKKCVLKFIFKWGWAFCFVSVVELYEFFIFSGH